MKEYTHNIYKWINKNNRWNDNELDVAIYSALLPVRIESVEWIPSYLYTYIHINNIAHDGIHIVSETSHSYGECESYMSASYFYLLCPSLTVSLSLSLAFVLFNSLHIEAWKKKKLTIVRKLTKESHEKFERLLR